MLFPLLFMTTLTKAVDNAQPSGLDAKASMGGHEGLRSMAHLLLWSHLVDSNDSNYRLHYSQPQITRLRHVSNKLVDHPGLRPLSSSAFVLDLVLGKDKQQVPRRINHSDLGTPSTHRIGASFFECQSVELVLAICLTHWKPIHTRHSRRHNL